MTISHFLANHIHHVMVGAVVTTDLWTDTTNQNYLEGFLKEDDPRSFSFELCDDGYRLL